MNLFSFLSFFCSFFLLSQQIPTYEKECNSKNERMLWLHITDHEQKKKKNILNYIFRPLLQAAVFQKQIICSHLFGWMYEKCQR